MTGRRGWPPRKPSHTHQLPPIRAPLPHHTKQCWPSLRQRWLPLSCGSKRRADIFLKANVAEDKANLDFFWSGDFWIIASRCMLPCVQNRVQKSPGKGEHPLKHKGWLLFYTSIYNKPEHLIFMWAYGAVSVWMTWSVDIWRAHSHSVCIVTLLYGAF